MPANDLSHFGSGVPQPLSYNELLESSNIIIVGRVGKLIQEGRFAGYDKNGVMIIPTSTDPLVGGVDYVDFAVDVEQIVKDDGTIAAGKQVILRMMGKPSIDNNHNTNIEQHFPLSRLGDRNLFMLTQNPDKQTYGLLYGPWSRFLIDGTEIKYSDGGQTPVDFAQKTSPVDFIKELEASMNRSTP
jgi:hypothetical protein